MANTPTPVEGSRARNPDSSQLPRSGPPPDFRLLFESAPGLYLVLRPDAPAFTIVAVSQSYLGATKTVREQILDRSVFEVFPDTPDDPNPTGARNLRASLERVVMTRAPDAMAIQRYDTARHEAEGGGFEERYWSAFNSPVPSADGTVDYIIHRVEDVTDFIRLKQRAVEQTRLAEELVQAIEDLKAFSSSVAHDLRAPLRALGGFASILEEDHADALDDEARRKIAIIRDSARKMAAIIDALVALARIGYQAIKKERFDMGALVAQVCAELTAAGGGANADIAIGALPQTWGDPALLRQVWVNLISNALKYSATRPRSRVQVSGFDSGEESVFCVTDNGVGFDMRHVDRLFGVFESRGRSGHREARRCKASWPGLGREHCG
jgi:signal transduction histidine kinase